MASNNMFAVLSDHESDDETTNVKQNQKNNEGKSRAEKRARKPNDNTKKGTVEQKQTGGHSKKHDRERQPQKGVSADPHPQDRHSGNGMGKSDKKGGSGKGNWGNYKDELKEQPETNEEGQEPVKQVEDNSLTYEEYLARNARQVSQQEATQEKKPLDLTTFTKEGCQLLETKDKRSEQRVTKQTKHQKNAAKYNLSSNTENSELLGFRTGLQTYTLRERGEKDETRERKPREEKPKQETTEEKGEGEQQEEATENTEKKDEKRDNRDNRGYKGGRGRGNNNRGKKYGYKNDGNNYYNKDRKQENKGASVNLEDDSSFPKLG